MDEQLASNNIFNEILSEVEASKAPETSATSPSQPTTQPEPTKEATPVEEPQNDENQDEGGEEGTPPEQNDEADSTPEPDLTEIKAKIDAYNPAGPDDEQEEETEIDPEYELYKQYKDDPNVKAVINARKEGKTLLDIAAELKADDPSKLTLSELFEKDLAKYPNLSESARKEAIEEFDGMSDFNKEKAVHAIRQELEAAHKAKLDQFLVRHQQQEEAQEREIAQARAEGHKELESLLQRPDHLKLQMTPERVQKLREFVAQNCPRDPKTGKYLVAQTFKAGLMEYYAKEIIAANTKDVATNAKKEILKDVTRPSKETTGTSGTIVKNGSESAADDWVKHRATAGW